MTHLRHLNTDVGILHALTRRFGDAEAREVVTCMVNDIFPGEVAAVSSFGAEAAVLLHMIALADRSTPVVFLDTEKHFDETLAYRDLLIDRLRLADVRIVKPDAGELARLDGAGTLWSQHPDGCCEIRKVAPLNAALRDFDAWFTGRKRAHGGGRSDLTMFEAVDGQIKVNPLVHWTGPMIEAYMENHALPRHPLVEQGYPSIGCAPCTAKSDGNDVRAGRWQHVAKNECGIHRRAVADNPRNIYAVEHTVRPDERAQANGHEGGVLWLTGLSGSGKSTISMTLERHLYDSGWQVFALDGDNLRHGLSHDLGFSPEDRHENIRRAAEAAKLLAEAGHLVVATFISPLQSDRDMARDIVGEAFHEVFIDADLATCEARDPKGLYVKARAGEIPEFTGISAPYEAPTAAEVHLRTDDLSVADSVIRLSAYADQQFRLADEQVAQAS